MDGESENVSKVVECPCGGTATLTTDPKTGEPASMLHTIPICSQYDRLSAEDYWEWLMSKTQDAN